MGIEAGSQIPHTELLGLLVSCSHVQLQLTASARNAMNGFHLNKPNIFLKYTYLKHS
jgi:hypothetical protein